MQKVLRATPQLRNGWDTAIDANAAQHGDIFLDGANTTDWDQVEW